VIASGQTLQTGQATDRYIFSVLQTGTTATPFLQSVIQASSGNATATFIETNALCSSGGGGGANADVFVLVPTLGGLSGPQLSLAGPISGPSGATYTNPITVWVNSIGGNGQGVPNVSIRLVSNQASPTVTCQTGAGADPGSVLTVNNPFTASNGVANCNPVFGGTGTGQYFVVVGAAAEGDPNHLGPDAYQTGPLGTTVPFPWGFTTFGPFSFNVTAPPPGLISNNGGNNQTGNPGQALPTALSAKVTDSTGNVPLPNIPVTWSINPAGAATLSNASVTSDANGLVSAGVTLASSAVGTVQVKVAATNTPNVAFTFTITVNVQIGSVTKISGDAQSQQQGASFTPLIVQVSNSSGQPVSNYPVTFSVVGPAVLTSSSTVNTSANGQAQATLLAGSSAGAVTVTAAAAGQSATFNLTVLPQGPTLTAGSFFNGASMQQGFISPCSLATIVATGLAPGLQGYLPANPFGFGPLPFTLSSTPNVSVTFGGVQAPVFNVANINGQQSVSVQVPCEVTPGSSVPVVVSTGGANASVNVQVQQVSPGIMQTVMSDGVTRAIIVRADGTFMSPSNPARKGTGGSAGEIVRAYVTGLGTTSPAIATNQVDNPGADLVGAAATVQGTVIVGITNSSGGGGGAKVISARYSPDLIGIYEVAFQIPADVSTGSSVNLSVGIVPVGGSTVSNSVTSKIIVQ
jgi:uncharacterized protein (TIGR03437 family)